MTTRPTFREGAPELLHRPTSANKQRDLYGVHRISQKRLLSLARQIAEHEKTVLCSVKQCRFLTTGQIQRLHFTDSNTQSARIRAANRMLSRLRDAIDMSATAYRWRQGGFKRRDLETYHSGT